MIYGYELVKLFSDEEENKENNNGKHVVRNSILTGLGTAIGGAIIDNQAKAQ